jgi:hypothetical protein
MGVDEGERCLVAAAHGNADCCRSGRRKAAVEFGSGARELAKGLKKRNVEACVVLVRARDRGLRLRGGLSSAAMRWRPVDARGSRGVLGAGQRGEATGAAKVKVTRRWQSGGQGGSSVPAAETGSRGAVGVQR